MYILQYVYSVWVYYLGDERDSMGEVYVPFIAGVGTVYTLLFYVYSFSISWHTERPTLWRKHWKAHKFK